MKNGEPFISAWKIESNRLKLKDLKIVSSKNEMILFLVIQLFLILIIYIVFNIFSVFMFCFAALFGVIILESINYVEHYGLVRNLKENGRYEALTEFHSWNSDFMLGRLLFHQLTLHSDHHLKASKKYQNLLNLPNAPSHPTGYPGMMLLSFFPPLWFWCMDYLVEEARLKSKNK